MSASPQISRRTFFVGSAAAMTTGLVVTYQLGTRLPPVPLPSLDEVPEPVGPPGTLNAFIHVTPDDRVVISIPEVEMGQRIGTALAQVVADELQARWDQVVIQPAPVDRTEYGRQVTDASSSVRQGHRPLQRMAAMARVMLIRAAAATWGVPATDCEARDGEVRHPASKRSLTFGALSELASRQRPPAEPLLLPSDRRTLVGRAVAAPGARAQLRGEVVYGLDVAVPGAKVAQVARAPWFGAALKRWDDTATRSVPGVTDVVRVPTGVAVVAAHTWAAEQGLRALEVEWSEPSMGRVDDDSVARSLAAAIDDGELLVERGDASAAGGREVRAQYRMPFLAHAALEPLSCTARVTGDGVELWLGTQAPTDVQDAVSAVLGVPPDAVTLHPVAIGGSFGRRLQTDFAVEAVVLAKALGQPVQVVWSRRDDIAGGFFRPAVLHRLTGRLDAKGWPVAWAQSIASARVAGRDGQPSDLALIYNIPHQSIRFASVELPVPAGAWRSGVHSHHGFAVECFIDELARAGGKDPVEARRRLLEGRPRHRRVLEAAVEAADYAREAPGGRARGVALYTSYGTVVAQVAEVSMDRGRVRVHRVVCAVDCGRAINPDGVTAQMEGGIAYGLSAALYGRLRISASRVQESNFHDYRALRLRDMPEIEVRLVPSDSPLGGAGEPGVPPIAPAVANAVASLTGRPVRRLPLSV